jgi:hypothetical protein
MTVDLCDYTVEQDIIYDKDERDCQFNDKRKYVVDLYAPKNCSYVPKESIPVVLFVHGGGWRRGDKSAWKYFLSRDINLLAVLINLRFGLYGNVGKALARRGIACGVMSYPLTQLSTIWLLLEFITSYISSLFISTVLACATGTVFLFVWNIMTLDSLSTCMMSVKEDFVFYGTALIFFNNILILTIISFQRDYHKLTRLHVSLMWTSLIVVVLVVSKTYILVVLTLVTFVIGQGILMNTNLNVQKLGLEQQVDSVAKCMKKIKGIGEDTGSFNPKEFYLMGHSAGGHICSIAALCDEYLKDQGMSNVDIKVFLCFK